MKTVIVVGGGASGMAAAYGSSQNHRTILLEKNEKLGKKVYITGKGRCNLTNASDMEEIMKNVVRNPRFLYSAFYSFTNDDVMHFMEMHGCPVKVERGNRVFPVSDRSSDVIFAWERALKERNVEIRLNTAVKRLLIEEGTVRGVETSDGKKIHADAVILCTGGVSYRLTGSTGDGHRLLRDCGHEITELYPSLVGLRTAENWTKDIAGLTLKNVGIRIIFENKCLYEDFGELLFTHTGVSGPTILSASSYLTVFLSKGKCADLYIDLKPALSEEELDERILRDFREVLNKKFKNALEKLLPKNLIPYVIFQTGIDPEKAVNAITKEERRSLLRTLKGFRLKLNGTCGFEEAIVTKGGISVKEIQASTMESKKIRNLYIAGELLDLDALTGGYNLQIAWSTGYLAGISIEGE